ncbi:hypothetical protein M3Y96_00063600 [Aphelenchoides besseyi]|nr:hypothetical protein M3Y96_00063600 [Aphelenchoides besseyi]
MDAHRLWLIGIAFVAMSMFDWVHAEFNLQGPHPVYTADGSSATETLEVTEQRVKFKVEKQGTNTGSEMEMTLGGCKFVVGYQTTGERVYLGGGGSVPSASSVTATASGSSITYGGQTATCDGDIKLEEVGGKFTVVVGFEYPKTGYPPFKFTFDNAVKFTPKEEKTALGAGSIVGIVGGAIGGVLILGVAAVGCCLNKPDQCFKWNIQKQKRMKAMGVDVKKLKKQKRKKGVKGVGDDPDMKTAIEKGHVKGVKENEKLKGLNLNEAQAVLAHNDNEHQVGPQNGQQKVKGPNEGTK